MYSTSVCEIHQDFINGNNLLNLRKDDKILHPLAGSLRCCIGQTRIHNFQDCLDKGACFFQEKDSNCIGQLEQAMSVHDKLLMSTAEK
jgi:hypothetical protein